MLKCVGVGGEWGLCKERKINKEKKMQKCKHNQLQEDETKTTTA